MGYCIIETDEGLTVTELQVGHSAKEAAESVGGTVIDPGPYLGYEEAEDAMNALQEELSDDDIAGSDVPGTQALEGREESE